MTASAKRKWYSGAAAAAIAAAFVAFAATPASAQTSQCIANVAAQGTADAITSAQLPCGTTTNLVILTAAAANVTTTPTYAPQGSLPLPIIRANGAAVALNDILPGYVALLSSTGSSWVLLNPATGIDLSNVGLLSAANVWTAVNSYSATATPATMFPGSLVVGGILASPPTFNANGEGAAYLSGTSGLILQGQGSARDFTVLNNTGAVALSVATGTTNVTVAGNATAGGSMTANYFLTPANTITLSGTTVPTNTTSLRYNLAGTNTLSGNTWGANVRIGGSSDNANLTVGGWPELLIAKNYGGNVFAGNRFGLVVQMVLNTSSVLANVGDGLVGESVKMIANVNAGGVTGGFGTSQFGIGSIFGSNPWCQLLAGATFYYECTGMEINASVDAGASASIFSVLQLITTSDHATHGTVSDKILKIGAQFGAIGVRDAMTFGDYQSQWPVDPNGYLMTVESGGNVSTVPTVAAGGIDLRQATFSGVGRVGGGFAFRSDGMQISTAGQVQPGYGLVDGASGGLTISVTEQKLTGAAVAVGGTGFTTGDLVSDAYGGVFSVTAAAGVVTGVTIKKAGWNVSPPANPVSTTALTRVGAGFGSGLTLNLTWTGQSALNLQANGAGTVALGAGTDVVKLPVVTTGTPVASLCLDASNNIIKKTTAGACI